MADQFTPDTVSVTELLNRMKALGQRLQAAVSPPVVRETQASRPCPDRPAEEHQRT